MMRVVERCATCGVEHEVAVEECEACGGALRWWCRSHSSEIGWLESAECRGCVEEKARPKPRPAPPPVRRTTPARVPAPTPPRVRPAPAARTPPAGTPVRSAEELPTRVIGAVGTARKEWPENSKRMVVSTLLWTWIPCIIIFSLIPMRLALESGGPFGELLFRGAWTGWKVGLFLGVLIILGRLSD